MRYEDRVQFRVQVQCQKERLFRLDERAQTRGPVMGPERGQERSLYPVP